MKRIVLGLTLVVGVLCRFLVPAHAEPWPGWRGPRGESCYASPAISDGQVFLRGFKHLFCIGRQTDRRGALGRARVRA
jgi:hypothetical protein